ncbi:hypothetical protein BRADI_3g25913v3, partial [Brachypodium distachyon]
QQEQLRVLHEKFKDEVNHQLLGFKNSLEDFDAYHAELKGVADKQKVSHKKLLQHADKTIGSQLSDADIKIAKVQKVRKMQFLNPRVPPTNQNAHLFCDKIVSQRARKKINSLKCVLKELITETAG